MAGAQRLKVLEFIMREVAKGNPFPKDRQIAEFMAWRNASSARDAVWGLVRDGYVLADTYGKNPNFRLPPPNPGR